MSDICLLCLLKIVKITEKHRVEGKGTFKVIPELESFSFQVERVSDFVCASCVKKLKKRRNLIKQVESIDAFYADIHSKALPSSSSSLKRASETCSDTYGVGVKVHRGIEGERLPSIRTEPPTEPTCSSPIRPAININNNPFSNANPQWPVSPIQPRKETQSSAVSVRVEWPSKTYERQLSSDLESLGKMLVRGTYKQIANAVWKCDRLKKQIHLLVLKDVDRECTNLCSKKNPSCLRSPSKEEILKFSMKAINKELKERAPLTFSVLVAASVNTRSRSKQNTRTGDDFWSPAVAMAAAVCLKNRSKYMNALQLLITIFSYHSGWQVCRN